MGLVTARITRLRSEDLMPDTIDPPFLARALADGHVTISGEGRNERIHYRAAKHSERWVDPEEKIRAEFWAEAPLQAGMPTAC